MDEQDERQRAIDALAMVREHQERTEKAARVPLWVYPAMFVLSAGLTASNDFVDSGGAKGIALMVLVVFAVVLVVTFAGKSAPLSRMRGVQRRQSFAPPVFGTMVIIAGAGAWLLSRYGDGWAGGIADSVGMHSYPNTVLGVLYGAVFTALFALSQVLSTAYQRRTGR